MILIHGLVWIRDGTGTGPDFGPAGRPATGRSILFFSYFFILKYSKFLVDLNRISQRMHKDPLVEADYINYDYLETKSVPRQILDRPVRSGLTFLDRYRYRS